MKPSPAPHSPAERRLYNFLLPALVQELPRGGLCWLGGLPQVWARSLLGSALVTQRNSDMWSCPALPSKVYFLLPTSIHLPLVALLSPPAGPNPSFPSQPISKAPPRGLIVDPSWSLYPLFHFMLLQLEQISSEQDWHEPCLCSGGLWALCPMHPAGSVHTWGGESEVWYSLCIMESWASPFLCLCVVSIAAEEMFNATSRSLN